MDLEFALIGSATLAGNAAVRHLKEVGVTPSDLTSENAVRLYTIVLDHMERYGRPPHPATLSELAGFDLSGIREPFKFYFDIFSQRRLKADLVSLSSHLMEQLEGGNSTEALGFIETELREIRRRSIVTSRAQPIFNLSDEVVDQYDRVKSGEHGILTRWPTFNDMTGGFNPGDFVLLTARTSIGKTWISLVMAIDAWHNEANRKRVLYVTTEMTQIRMARRFVAIHLRVPFKPLRKGKLGEFAEIKFKESMHGLKAEENFFIIGGDFDFSVDALHATLDQVEPDILFLDGAYLMKGEGGTRTERAANSFDSLKRLSHQTQIPFVLTTQLNRGAAVPGQSPGIHNIALTDVAAWHAEMAFALTQTSQQKDKRRMQIDPLKIREGEANPVVIEWDFESMSFEEIDPAQEDPSTPTAGDAKEDVSSEF